MLDDRRIRGWGSGSVPRTEDPDPGGPKHTDTKAPDQGSAKLFVKNGVLRQRIRYGTEQK